MKIDFLITEYIRNYNLGKCCHNENSKIRNNVMRKNADFMDFMRVFKHFLRIILSKTNIKIFYVEN